MYGYFAREGTLRVQQYDDMQLPIEGEQLSFQRMLFVLFLAEGLLLAQSIRVYNYEELTGPLVREGLFSELEVIFKTSGLSCPKLKLNRVRQEYTREQMLDIFFKHEISRVEVDQLYGTQVPADVRLFNPNFDADEFTKGVINEALAQSSRVEWTGEQLQKAKIVKGVVTAGSLKALEGTDEYGEPREWLRSAPEEIVLALNTNAPFFPEDDLERLLAFVRRKFGLLGDRLKELRGRRESSSDLPLFGER